MIIKIYDYMRDFIRDATQEHAFMIRHIYASNSLENYTIDTQESIVGGG